MKKLLKQYDIIDEDYRPLPHVYELRMKGLTQKLSNDELASAILHLVKHRGSSIETVDDNEEGAKKTEKAKEVLGKNAKLLAEGKFVCEVQYARLQEGGSVRGHDNNFKTKDYVTDFRVPYTNNEAERGCRVIKTKKNVSRQFKSKEGADAYASMMTVIMTARKRKENVLKTMEGILA